MVLDRAEAAVVADEFGVSDDQVRRDHLLSHLLAVLASRLHEQVVFFGGTAPAEALAIVTKAWGKAVKSFDQLPH